VLIAFPGKRVVVAGAARGIGRAIAVEFARLGADVHACDILVDEVRAYADEFDGEGMIRPVWVDVTDPRSVVGVIEAAEAGTGTGAVDVLVYVAGGVRVRRRCRSTRSSPTISATSSRLTSPAPSSSPAPSRRA